METQHPVLYKYAVLVHNNEFFKEKNWNDSFINELESLLYGCYYTFEPDGQLWSGKTPKGLYSFINIEQLYSCYPRMIKDLTGKQKCPYLGQLLGAFTWEWYAEPLEDKKHNALSFAYVSGGGIYNTITNQNFECIKENEYSLADITSKYGFDDGNAFLYYVKDKKEYDAYVKQLISDKLNDLNIPSNFITYGTSHNPVQIDKYKPADELKLKTEAITCWSMDTKLFKDENFNRFLSE